MKHETTSENESVSLLKGCLREMLNAAQEAPAIYFAPIVGAITGVARQWSKLQPRPAIKHKLA